jgi:hypothetical protein
MGKVNGWEHGTETGGINSIFKDPGQKQAYDKSFDHWKKLGTEALGVCLNGGA